MKTQDNIITVNSDTTDRHIRGQGEMLTIYEMLNWKMVLPSVEAKAFEDVLRQLGGAATKAGYTKDTYVDALVEHEKE